MQKLNKELSATAGVVMFAGQMTILLLQYSDYIFSTPMTILDFYKLSRSDKKQIFSNLFCTMKGVGVLCRSFANALTLALRFRGVALFTSKFLFENATASLPYSITAATTVFYRVLATQSLNDYRKVFSEPAQADQVQTQAQNSAINNSQRVPTRILLILLSVSTIMVFFLRALSTPVLYTGPVDHPEDNYGIKETILACVGLGFGVLAGWQYCKFIWGLGSRAIVNTSSRLFALCDKNRNDVLSERLLGPDISENTDEEIEVRLTR